MKQLYFAYGSNMDQERLEDRVGKVRRVGVSRLHGWKLTFNCGQGARRFANIVMTGDYRNDMVEGVVYEMEDVQLKRLDGFEGNPYAYQRLEYPYNKRRSMYVYICLNPTYVPYPEVLYPTMEYIGYIAAGCARNKLVYTQKIVQEMIDTAQFF